MIKKFLHYFFKVETEDLITRTSELRVFDLVSTVPNPSPMDLYVVYAIDHSCVFLLKWYKYGANNVFDANIDKQVCFSLHTAKKELYKVINFKIKPEDIIRHASQVELNTLAMRISDVFVRMYPLMGVFSDPNDGHLMFVTNQVGSAEDGHSTIYDLDLAPTAGIFHFMQIAHVVKTSDFVKGKYFTTFTGDQLRHLFCGAWRVEILRDIVGRIFAAIAESERYEYPAPIILNNGITRCISNTETNNTSGTRQDPVPLNSTTKQNKEKKK